MALVGDRERERTSALLGRHYLEGRLTVEELAERVELVLHARDHADLRAACRRLPAAPVTRLSLEPALSVARGIAVLAVKAVVWLLASLILLLGFVIWLAAHGPQLGGLLGFPLVWLAVTWLLFARRGGHGTRSLRR